jgi:hypothetical protein
MTRNAVDLVSRASESSTVVNRVRSVIAGSVVCTFAASAVRSLAGARQRMVVGLRGTGSALPPGFASQRLEGMVSDSRVVRALSSLLTVPATVPREAQVVHLLDPILGLDLPGRMRVAACTILAAVATHTLLMAVLAVPVHEVGWAMRAALAAASAIVMRWPEPFAAAWQDRTSNPDGR